MPIAALPPDPLPIAPAGPAPDAARPAPRPHEEDTPTFSQVLSRRKQASPEPAAGHHHSERAHGSVASRGKPAESEHATTPTSSTSAPESSAPTEQDAGELAGDRDTGSTQQALADAQAAAQAQSAPPAVPSLPTQALDIAAQSAALQSQSAARRAARPDGSRPVGTLDPNAQRAGATPWPATATAQSAQAATQGAQLDPHGHALPGLLPSVPPSVHPSVVAARGARAEPTTLEAASDTQGGAAPAPWPTAVHTIAMPLPEPSLRVAQTRQQSGTEDGLGMLAASMRTAAAHPEGTSLDTRSASPPLHFAVASPVGSADWGRAVGRQLVLLGGNTSSGQHTAELRLDPPDLGPLRVTLSLSDGVASAHFVSAHAAVRQALESALPQLQEALADAGISLGQAGVGEQTGQSAQDQSLAGRSGGGQATTDTPAQGDPDLSQPITAPRDANGLVDTFA